MNGRNLGLAFNNHKGRLKTLVNENGDSYTFEYDERDRLIRETGFDGKMTRYTYNPAGELIREEEYASGNIDVRARPLRTTTYHRDRIGRIRQKDSHLDGGEILAPTTDTINLTI